MSPLQTSLLAQTRRHFFRDCGVGLGKMALASLLANGRPLTGGETAAAMPGVAVAIATDQPGGFTDHDLGTFAAVMPALGLASYRYGLARLTSEILGVYLGPRTARQLLSTFGLPDAIFDAGISALLRSLPEDFTVLTGAFAVGPVSGGAFWSGRRRRRRRRPAGDR